MRRPTWPSAATAPPRPGAASFDSGTYSEIIALVDERGGRPSSTQVRRLLRRWPDPGRRRSDGPGGSRRRGPPLVSSAGLLGFQELSDLCRDSRTCRIEPPGPDLLADVNTARLNASTCIMDFKQLGEPRERV